MTDDPGGLSAEPVPVIAGVDEGIEPAPEPIPAPPITRDRGRRALMTWSAGLVFSVITIAVGFVSTPLLIRWLGADRLGAARSAAEWFSYILLADLGLGATVAVLLSRAHGVGGDRPWAVARFGVRLQAVSLVVLIPVALVMAWFMPSLINVPAELHRELRISSLLLVAGMAAYPFSVHRIMLEVAQRGYMVNIGLTGHSLIWTGLAVLLAWLGWGLIGQSVAAVVAGLAFAAFAVVAARALLGRARPAPARFAPRELFREAWPVSLNALARRLMLSSDLILVGLMLNASAVTTLFVTQRLVVLAAGQVNSIANASWAGLAEMRRSGEHALFERRVCEVIRLIVGLNLAVAGAAAAINPHFVRLWVGEELYGGDFVSMLSVLTGVALGITATFTLLLDLSGDARIRMPAALAAGFIKVVIAICLLQYIGIVAVLVAHVLAWVVAEAWWYARILIVRYGVSSQRIAQTLLQAVVFGGAWLSLCLVASAATPPIGDWLRLTAAVGVVGTLTLLYCWWVILNQQERRDWRLRFSRVRIGNR